MKSFLSTVLFFLWSISSYGQCTIPIFDSQQDVNDFVANNPGCTEVNQLIVASTAIIDLTPLNQITSVIGDLTIHSCNNLLSLSGLENINFIGGNLTILNNNLLPTLQGLNGLLEIGNILNVEGNNSLISLDGLNSLTSILGNSAVSDKTSVFFNNSLETLFGLNNLVSVNKEFSINFNDSLEHLDDLSSLVTVEGKLDIFFNDSLTGIDGLSSLTTVGDLSIAENNSLATLEGLESLEEINGFLIVLYNDVLNSISSLNGVMPSSLTGTIRIEENFQLSLCNVLPVCANIDNPDITLTIFSNAPGCNSILELEASCTLIIIETLLDKKISTYPNPVSEKLMIKIEASVSLISTKVYSTLGNLLFETLEKNIDFSNLSSGVYFLKIETNQGIITKKIIKE
jgi:hypothetical protein